MIPDTHQCSYVRVYMISIPERLLMQMIFETVDQLQDFPMNLRTLVRRIFPTETISIKRFVL